MIKSSPQPDEKKSTKGIARVLPFAGLAFLFLAGFTYLFILITLPPPNFLSQSRVVHSTKLSDPLVSGSVTPPAPTSPTVNEDDFVLGDKTSSVRIVIFSDFACPFCKTLSSDLRRIIEAHPQVHLVWKNFPLTSIHPEAFGAHLAARCAGEQGQFWPYHDQLFAAQGKFSHDTYTAIAESLGIRSGAFQACMDSTRAILRVQSDVEEANALGIDGTPYLFVGDQKISGAISYEELERTVEITTLINQKQ